MPQYMHMGLTGDAAREYRVEDLARACAKEAWDVCAADQREALSGAGAGQEPGTIEALTDLVRGIPHGSRTPTPDDWRAFVAAYEQRLQELRGEIES